MLIDSGENMDTDRQACGGLLSAGGTGGGGGGGGGGGRMSMQLRVVGGTTGTGSASGGYCSPLKVCEDNFWSTSPNESIGSYDELKYCLRL